MKKKNSFNVFTLFAHESKDVENGVKETFTFSHPADYMLMLHSKDFLSSGLIDVEISPLEISGES